MEFLACLIIMFAFAFYLNDFIFKKSNICYFIAYVISFSDIIYRIFYMHDLKLTGLIYYLEKPIRIGALSAAIFVLVMYAGALDTKKIYTKKLLRIRDKLSIIASIIFLAHVIPYAYSFFKVIGVIKINSISMIVYLLVSVTSMLGLLIIIPLWITSYKKIRKKMSAKAWKNLQRFSYLVYALIYVHVIFVFIQIKEKDYFKFAVYSIVFLLYAFLRIRKAIKKNH